MSNFVKRVMSIRILFPLFVAVILSGCGGGGGGDGGGTPPTPVYITGTAAAGAPVIGYVSVRDSSTNPQPVLTNIPIEANGHYSVEVTGLTPPYAFLATGTVGGKSVSLYSAATSADEGNTINITPFTDLIIRNIAASAVDTYINNGGISGLTPTELDAQRVALTTQLAPALLAMGLSDTIDLLRATFNADHTDLDRFMDVVKVSTTPTTATITNILDAANTLIVDTAAGTYTGTLGTGGLAPSGTPLEGILQTFDAISALFATSLPSQTDPDLLALFSSDYMDDGMNRDIWLGFLTGEPTIIGVKFTDFVLESVDMATGIAEVHATMLLANGVTEPEHQKSKQMKLVGGVWQFYGNQRIVWTRVMTEARQDTCNSANPACSMVPTYRTGLFLEIYDRSTAILGGAVVTGPGLPAGGVILAAQAGSTTLSIVTPNPLCPGCIGEQLWDMTDEKIAEVLPDSVYTVNLYDNSVVPVLLATYTEVLPVAPALNTEVAALSYPSIDGMVNLAGITDTTLTPAWTIPAGLRGKKIGVALFSAPDYLGVRDELTFNTASSGTSTLVITAPATGSWTFGYYYIDARDQYNGRVGTIYW